MPKRTFDIGIMRGSLNLVFSISERSSLTSCAKNEFLATHARYGMSSNDEVCETCDRMLTLEGTVHSLACIRMKNEHEDDRRSLSTKWTKISDEQQASLAVSHTVPSHTCMRTYTTHTSEQQPMGASLLLSRIPYLFVRHLQSALCAFQHKHHYNQRQHNGDKLCCPSHSHTQSNASVESSPSNDSQRIACARTDRWHNRKPMTDFTYPDRQFRACVNTSARMARRLTVPFEASHARVKEWQCWLSSPLLLAAS